MPSRSIRDPLGDPARSLAPFGGIEGPAATVAPVGIRAAVQGVRSDPTGQAIVPPVAKSSSCPPRPRMMSRSELPGKLVGVEIAEQLVVAITAAHQIDPGTARHSIRAEAASNAVIPVIAADDVVAESAVDLIGPAETGDRSRRSRGPEEDVIPSVPVIVATTPRQVGVRRARPGK